MGVKGDWEDHLEPVRPRPPQETSNPVSSDGKVDIKKGIFNDERLPHTVYVDSIAQQTIDQFREKGVDLMVREVPMEHNYVTSPNIDEGSYGDHCQSPDLVLFDLDEMKIAAYDAKSVPVGEEGMEEIRKWGSDVRAINNFYDLDWRATGHDIQKRHINDEYNSPDRSPRGLITTEESYEKVMNSDDLRRIFYGLYGGAADMEDAMLVSEVKEEWNL